jgi:hypothetical protein
VSSGGLLPFRRFAEQIGLTRTFADALDDPGDPALTAHTSYAAPANAKQILNLEVEIAHLQDNWRAYWSKGPAVLPAVLPELEGSDRQVNWAEKIRERLLPRAAIGPQAFADWLVAQTSAHWWIEVRDEKVEPRYPFQASGPA